MDDDDQPHPSDTLDGIESSSPIQLDASAFIKDTSSTYDSSQFSESNTDLFNNIIEAFCGS